MDTSYRDLFLTLGADEDFAETMNVFMSAGRSARVEFLKKDIPKALLDSGILTSPTRGSWQVDTWELKQWVDSKKIEALWAAKHILDYGIVFAENEIAL